MLATSLGHGIFGSPLSTPRNLLSMPNLVGIDNHAVICNLAPGSCAPPSRSSESSRCKTFTVITTIFTALPAAARILDQVSHALLPKVVTISAHPAPLSRQPRLLERIDLARPHNPAQCLLGQLGLSGRGLAHPPRIGPRWRLARVRLLGRQSVLDWLAVG